MYGYMCTKICMCPGIEFDFIPETNGIPLVADMSSNILTKPFEISKVSIQVKYEYLQTY